MMIDILFWYRQEYLPTKRHRKTWERELPGTVSVEPTEPSASEFPVAFIVSDLTSVYEGAESYDDFNEDKYAGYIPFHEEIRTFDGKLYKPARITHGVAVSTLFEGSGYMKKNLEYLYRKEWIPAPKPGAEFTDKSIVVNDRKDETEREIRELAKNYIFFDGKFWQRCAEPRYVVCTFGLGHNHGGTGLFIEDYYNDNIPARNYFNALQRDEAIAYGKAVASRRGDTEDVDRIGMHNYIRVVMPEAVKCNPAKDHGSGDPFMNRMEELIESSDDTVTAGILCLMETAAAKSSV